LFASAIALLKPLQEDDQTVRVRRSRIWRFGPLPFILVGATVVIVLLLSQLDLDTLSTMILYRPGAYQSVQAILWNRRALDILAMALLILTGVLGVATLLKQRERK
ncbi:MAG: hypothetical protein FWC59_02490, partial [Actinomycetia bacterium]|nr:hypothetical protein [Actinomycetes bacterium]